MQRRVLSPLIYCLALLILVGCGSPVVDPNATVQTQTVDGLNIGLEAPKAPKLLDQAGFVVTLTDAGGQPVDGADVYLELSMPAMPMGTNKPVASAEGNGRYRAQGVFDMLGEWDVIVHATVDGKEHAATFKSMVE
jgi:hypothetical protein